SGASLHRAVLLQLDVHLVDAIDTRGPCRRAVGAQQAIDRAEDLGHPTSRALNLTVGPATPVITMPPFTQSVGSSSNAKSVPIPSTAWSAGKIPPRTCTPLTRRSSLPRRMIRPSSTVREKRPRARSE